MSCSMRDTLCVAHSLMTFWDLGRTSFLLDNIASSRQYQVVSIISRRPDNIRSSRQYQVVPTISRFAVQMTNYTSPEKKYLGGDEATGWSAAELTRFTQIFLVLLVVFILLVSCNDAEQPTALPTVVNNHRKIPVSVRKHQRNRRPPQPISHQRRRRNPWPHWSTENRYS